MFTFSQKMPYDTNRLKLAFSPVNFPCNQQIAIALKKMRKVSFFPYILNIIHLHVFQIKCFLYPK